MTRMRNACACPLFLATLLTTLQLSQILSKVCDILGIVESIIGISDDIMANIDSLGDWIDDALDSLNPKNWFRQLSEGDAATCTGHLTTCDGDDVAACDACLKSDETCDDCKTCFQPLFNSVPEMDGICVGTKDLREFLLADTPALITLQVSSIYFCCPIQPNAFFSCSCAF